MITKLTIEHVDSIVKQLSEFYQHRNSVLGSDYYKSDFSFLQKHISARLSGDKGPIYYYGIVENNQIKAFINYFDNQDAKIIEVWCLVNTSANEQELQVLMQHCVNEYQSKAYKKLLVEFSDDEKMCTQIINNLGGKKLLNTYYIQ